MAKKLAVKRKSSTKAKVLVSPLQKHKCGDCDKKFSVMMRRNRNTGEMEYYCAACWKSNFESGPKYERRMKGFQKEQERIRAARSKTKKRVVKKTTKKTVKRVKK